MICQDIDTRLLSLIECNRSSLKLYMPGVRSLPRLYQSQSFHMRLFRESDIDAIHSLFDASFPLHYGDSFYDSLRVQFFKGNKLITYVVETLSDVVQGDVSDLGYS